MITPPNCTATCIGNHEHLLGVFILLHKRKQTRSACMREKDWRCPSLPPPAACSSRGEIALLGSGVTSPALGALYAGGSVSHFRAQWRHSYQKQVYSAPMTDMIYYAMTDSLSRTAFHGRLNEHAPNRMAKSSCLNLYHIMSQNTSGMSSMAPPACTSDGNVELTQTATKTQGCCTQTPKKLNLTAIIGILMHQ